MKLRPSLLCLAGILILGFLLTRRLDQILTPQLKEEDGLLFFAQANNDGWRAVLGPYMGYLHLAPRLVAALLVPLPLEYVPLAYNFAGMLVVALVAFRLLTARIPPLAGLAGALAIVVVPSSGAVYGNINCLHFALASLLVVNLLEPAPTDLRPAIRRTIEMLLAALSGPEGLILAPFSLIRAWQWRRQRGGWLVLAGWWAGAGVQFLLLHDNPRVAGPLRNAAPSVALLARYVKMLFGQWLGAPDDGRVALIVLLVVVLVFALLLWRHPYRYEVLAMLAAALVLLCAGRLAGSQWPQPFALGARLVFLPYVLLVWTLGWLAAGVTGWRRLAPALLFLGVAASSLPAWAAKPIPDCRWPRQIAALRAGDALVLADPRSVLGDRCFIPVANSIVLFAPGLGSDGSIHAFAICLRWSPKYPVRSDPHPVDLSDLP